MSAQTVSILQKSGYYLYVFKAVRASAGAVPTVWMQAQGFTEQTSVTWVQQYAAYTAPSAPLSDGQQVTPMASYAIDPGMTLEVNTDYGTGQIVASGTAGAISITNLTSTQFTCGISQACDSGENILCALPIFPNYLTVLQPVEQVLLLFATQAAYPGTVADRAFAPALLVDTSGGPRTVSFDIDTAWQGNTAPWATQYPAQTNIQQLLIKTGPGPTDLT
jgi:hypothetical protein